MKHKKNRSDVNDNLPLIDENGKMTLKYHYCLPKNSKVTPLEEGYDWYRVSGRGKVLFIPKDRFLTMRDKEKEESQPKFRLSTDFENEQ